jgi:hypothetical protein
LPAKRESDGTAYHVGSQVNAENGDDTQRQRSRGQNEEKERGDFRDVGSQGVGNGLLEVVEDQTTYRMHASISQDQERLAVATAPSSTPVTMDAKLSLSRI